MMSLDFVSFPSFGENKLCGIGGLHLGVHVYVMAMHTQFLEHVFFPFILTFFSFYCFFFTKSIYKAIHTHDALLLQVKCKEDDIYGEWILIFS